MSRGDHRFDELAQFPLRVGEAVHRSEARVVEHADVLAQDDFRGEKIEPNVLPEIDDPRGAMSMNTNVTVASCRAKRFQTDL